MKKSLLALIVIVGFSFSTSASHMMGGYIWFTCADDPSTSQLEYQANMVLLFDTQGASPVTNPSLTYGNGQTVGLTTTSSFLTPVGANRTAEVFYYTGSATLQPNTMYNFEYSICCRPANVNNVNAQPAYYLNTILRTGANCNSSPSIMTPMWLHWPLLTPWGTSFAVTDPDQDQIAFVLDTPMQSSSLAVQYSVSAPAGGMPALDSATGLFTFIADTTGLYAFGYLINAYDANGVMTSTTRVDLPIGIIPPPSSNTPNLINISTPPGLVNNEQYFTSSGGDTLTFSAVADSAIQAEVFYPSFVDSNEVYIDLQSFKQSSGASASINWTPSANSDVNEFPVVIRFTAQGFSRDVSFIAKNQDNISVAEYQSFEAILYPNPSSGSIQINLERPIEQCSIVDAQGRVVYEGEVDRTSLAPDLDLNLESGVYFIRLYTDTGHMKVLPLIIE